MENLNGCRVLVVGGGGFIGQHIVFHLLKNNANVTVIDVIPPVSEHYKLEWLMGDVRDEAFFASAAQGHNIAIFLANSSLPASGNMNLAGEISAHVQMSVKCAEICEEQGVEKFIFASSGGTVYGVEAKEPLKETSRTFPKNAYGISKLSIEHYLRLISSLRSMRATSLRLSNPYGEGQKAFKNQGFIAAVMQKAISGDTLTVWGDGTVERDFIYIGDVARAFTLACTCNDLPDIINIGYGESCSLLKIISIIEEKINKKINVVFESERAIDVHTNTLDIDLAGKILGWRPLVTLNEGIALTSEWWKINKINN